MKRKVPLLFFCRVRVKLSVVNLPVKSISTNRPVAESTIRSLEVVLAAPRLMVPPFTCTWTSAMDVRFRFPADPALLFSWRCGLAGIGLSPLKMIFPVPTVSTTEIWDITATFAVAPLPRIRFSWRLMVCPLMSNCTSKSEKVALLRCCTKTLPTPSVSSVRIVFGFIKKNRSLSALVNPKLKVPSPITLMSRVGRGMVSPSASSSRVPPEMIKSGVLVSVTSPLIVQVLFAPAIFRFTSVMVAAAFSLPAVPSL